MSPGPLHLFPNRSVTFRAERESTWRELEKLLTLGERRGLAALSAQELVRLPRVYRASVSSLSIARAISLDQALLTYLEQLCARGYMLLYGVRPEYRTSFVAFFASGFPTALARMKWYVVLAALALIGGGAIGYALCHHNPDLYYTLMGDMAQGRTPDSTTAELRAGLYEQESWSATLTHFASFLFSHNSQVALLAFSIGFLFGLPTFLLLLYNGISLGAFVWLYTSRGLGLDVWGWLLPHGVFELTAIVFAGGAGLRIGATLILPRATSLREAFRDAGREAGLVMLGAICMLAIAAVLEGIVRQTVTDLHWRALFIASGGLTLGGYLWWGLRNSRRHA